MPEQFNSSDRNKVESFFNVGTDIIPGIVKIDPEKCIGCGLCAGACATGVLEVINKKARMVEEMPICLACADCIAICPEDAVEILQSIAFSKAFRLLDRGELSKPRRF
jgi:ferredoxin